MLYPKSPMKYPTRLFHTAHLFETAENRDTVLQICIIFAVLPVLHNKYVLEYVELSLVQWNSLSLIMKVTLLGTK